MLNKTILGQTIEIKWTQDNRFDLTEEDIFLILESKTGYYNSQQYKTRDTFTGTGEAFQDCRFRFADHTAVGYRGIRGGKHREAAVTQREIDKIKTDGNIKKPGGPEFPACRSQVRRIEQAAAAPGGERAAAARPPPRTRTSRRTSRPGARPRSPSAPTRRW